MEIIELSKLSRVEDIEGLPGLFSEAFGVSQFDDLLKRLNEKRELSILVAYQGDNPVGFKIGYRQAEGVFFSWLGHVLSSNRRKGVGRALLKYQHELCVRRGYREVQTEASGHNQSMLILDLQEGFEVYGVRTGSDGDLVVQLRKPLVAAKI